MRKCSILRETAISYDDKTSILTSAEIAAADRILAAGNRVEMIPHENGVQVAEIRRKVTYRPEKAVDNDITKGYNINNPN